MPGNWYLQLQERRKEGRQIFFYVSKQWVLTITDIRDKRKALNSPNHYRLFATCQALS